MAQFNIGDEITIKATFKNKVRDVSDPTTVTLIIRDPSGNEVSYTYSGGQLTRESTGVYYYNLQIDEDGNWYFRWKSTGNPMIATEYRIKVNRSYFDTP